MCWQKILKTPRCRQVVQCLRGGYRISERRACVLIRLQREGWAVGKTMVSRLYREEGLALRWTVPRKRRVAVERTGRIKPSGLNPVWSLDFVSDQLADGRRFRVLTVGDVYTRESLAIVPGPSLRGEEVVRVLQRFQQERGGPQRLLCDLGSEFSSQVLDLWAYQNGVKIEFSRPGKPTDNGDIESFNGTFRDECLNTHWFTPLGDAWEIIKAWRREYNERSSSQGPGGEDSVRVCPSDRGSPRSDGPAKPARLTLTLVQKSGAPQTAYGLT